jgi:hypothetical protein
MCLLSIQKAIDEAEAELQAAGAAAERKFGSLSPSNRKLLDDKLTAFTRLRAALADVRGNYDEGECDPFSEDPCFDPKSND